MPEIWIAGGIVALLIVAGFSAQLFHATVLLTLGAAITAVGLTVGVVVGIFYHVALYRALAPMGMLEPGWWWRPASYNTLVPSVNRPVVMSWFYAGVISMAAALAGCSLVLAGILIL